MSKYLELLLLLTKVIIYFLLVLTKQFKLLIAFVKYRYFNNIVAGETDWKIIVIDVNDPLADHINGKHNFCEQLKFTFVLDKNLIKKLIYLFRCKRYGKTFSWLNESYY